MLEEKIVASAVDRLAERVRGGVIRPADDGYDAARQLTLPGRDPRPLAIVRPLDTDDVAAAVAVLVGEGVPFAVRGGGHHPAGWSGGDGKVVLDMRAMDGIELDVPGRVATAQGGATTGAYTKAAGEHGLATGFGDTPTVGVAGLTIGGGLGFLSRAHGLTVDNLLGAEVVTADGRAVWTDAEAHPDLFWALRGGGGGLGVITRLRFALRDVPSVYGGMLVLPASPEVLHGVVAAALEAPDELTVIVQTMLAPPLPFFPPELHGKALVFVQGAYFGDEEAGREAFAPLRALARPLADQVQARPYPSLFEEPEGAPPLRLRFATTFRDSWDLATAERVLALVTASAAGLRAVQFRPLGGAIARVPDDETAYPHRRRRLLVGTVAGGPPTLDQAPALAWIAEARAALREGDVAFFSFLDAGGATPRDAFPGVWDRLQAVRRAYDPEGVFGAHLAATLD